MCGKVAILIDLGILVNTDSLGWKLQRTKFTSIYLSFDNIIEIDVYCYLYLCFYIKINVYLIYKSYIAMKNIDTPESAAVLDAPLSPTSEKR